ncbi:MAG: dipeptidyl peptidase 3 [Bacteroidetes bacterium]|nr:dipeptidyl peptidase 3 [Bacteroidota bacterium]MBU1720968.1 dipeptidyl peptidase 3 [Bacteroidota bacterium]
MKKATTVMLIGILAGVLAGCGGSDQGKNETNMKKEDQPQTGEFKYFTEKFADIKIMRYQVPGFENLSLKQKKLLYFLSEAALCGRDITWDQYFKYNLVIRKTLEEIYANFKGDKNTDDWKKFVVYLKRVWFSLGIHHHSSTEKFRPDFSQEYFAELIKNSEGAKFPIEEGKTLDEFVAFLSNIIFDPNVSNRRVCQEDGMDMIKYSASNFYENISQAEVEAFYKKMRNPNDKKPISIGLNSKLMKEDGKIVEKTYKVGGMYSAAIEKIVFWLGKAISVAETENQKKSLSLLVEYYKTGDLKTWDDYNVAWVQDTAALVDVANGFIEVYGDPMAMKATFESVVNFKNLEATKRSELISSNAQWFEDNSPIDAKYKKETVKGVIAKVITTVMLGGDCYPSTPIGVNLPNASWIREQHGSKSVTMENITYSYDQVSLTSGVLEEFAFSQEEIDLQRKYGPLADNLHTDLHECLGHGSGKLAPGVSEEALKNYHSPLEEARADLFALYYLMDQKLVDLGIMPTLEVAKAEYAAYVRNGLITQLTRIEPGKNIEQAHMRCRALIANWVFEKGKAEKVIEKKTRDGKTFFVVNDYVKLRNLFGELLKEMQRIKSEGDFEAGKNMVETYAVKVDPVLHKEVLERFKKLDIAPYGGFLNPRLVAVMKTDTIADVIIEYPDDFTEQSLYYSKNYSFLPLKN